MKNTPKMSRSRVSTGIGVVFKRLFDRVLFFNVAALNLRINSKMS
jgi:hypothetical protein